MKLTRWNLSQKRILVLTTERLYLFDEGSKLIRKQNISQIDAIIKSQTSNEIVFIFPDKDSKDLRIKGLADEMELQSLIQSRFLTLKPNGLLRIYSVKKASLQEFTMTNKYGYINMPSEAFRVHEEEFKPEDGSGGSHNSLPTQDSETIDFEANRFIQPQEFSDN